MARNEFESELMSREIDIYRIDEEYLRHELEMSGRTLEPQARRMTIVVSGTSPIRALHFLAQITLLEQLFGTVIVPPAVAEELARARAPFSPVDVSAFSNLEVRAPRDQQLVQHYIETIEAGEAQAIVLAVELKATPSHR